MSHQCFFSPPARDGDAAAAMDGLQQSTVFVECEIKCGLKASHIEIFPLTARREEIKSEGRGVNRGEGWEKGFKQQMPALT